jgi:membrane-bound ClpP family serine protease
MVTIFGIEVAVWLVVVVSILIIAFIVFATLRSVRAHKGQVSTGREEMVGKSATVRIALDPKGEVLFKGELWNAISESGRIEIGEEVTISRVDGLKLYVKNY